MSLERWKQFLPSQHLCWLRSGTARARLKKGTTSRDQEGLQSLIDPREGYHLPGPGRPAESDGPQGTLQKATCRLAALGSFSSVFYN